MTANLVWDYLDAAYTLWLAGSAHGWALTVATLTAVAAADRCAR